jgi:hypothetical protein
MRLLTYQLMSYLAFPATTVWMAAVLSAHGRPAENQAKRADRPFLAVWRDRDAGFLGGTGEDPYLRFAIWGDGRVLYAKDPAKWGHEVRRGKLAPSRVARLKAALADTGIFDLKETGYLVPHGPVDCLMVDLGGKQKMLYWDEIESPNYGINFDPKPHHLEFKRCWKAVNHLGLVALPDDGEALKERVKVPQSWYLKQEVQSE